MEQDPPVTDTWVSLPKRPAGVNRQACLVHIYPTGPQMGARCSLVDQSVMLGRGEDCQVRIQDNSVSRRHARIDPTLEGFEVIDLGSTNGTFVNDIQTNSACSLRDGDYLRVGNCIYRFLAGGNVEAEYHEEIYRLTIMDGLTQCFNHRYLSEFLDREVARSTRHNRPLAVVLFDIDWFKRINDERGHLAGDFTLRELAMCVRATIRREDVFARYGGEEFALALIETPHREAMVVAEKLRQAVAKHTFSYDDRTFSVTISLGVAWTDGNPPIATSNLLRAADANLYEAKRTGRNRVVG